MRPIRREDFSAVIEVHRASTSFDGVPQVMTLDELEDELDDEHVLLSTDTSLVLVDDEPVAYAYTYHLPSEVREERCYIWGQVAPAHRRTGIGTALMEWGLGRAEAQLCSSDRSLPRYIRTDRYDHITGAHVLFERMGMRPVRYMEELLRPLTDLPPIPEVEGIRVLPWPDDRDEEIREEKDASFADHWGSTPTSPARWQQMVRGHGARPDLSFVAVDDDGRVVAHCLNKRFAEDDDLLGRSDGWIDTLGTLREWRGHGIASALVAHSLHAFAAAGLTHASIGVDSENPSGAARLYRALGFEPRQRSITHELEVHCPWNRA